MRFNKFLHKLINAKSKKEIDGILDELNESIDRDDCDFDGEDFEVMEFVLKKVYADLIGSTNKLN